ncbi:DNA-J related domain-containing protein [Oceanobacter mangrovi]|uniref:DNA-J related domain-containing protein n=1 Tax=Oceanobacter mangrovi TaxID=2862510 RepID=UPI001C8D89A5|nr:DNA-J related domain-containing protein [Oceanobacter mangrovi]
MLNLKRDRIDPPSEMLDTLQELLASRLRDGDCHTEYQLIQWLKQPSPGLFQADALADSLSLFRCHFLVMHCLYKLRHQLLVEQAGILKIDPLGVQLFGWRTDFGSDTLQLAASDPLADYYLNLEHLSTDRDTVDKLLRGIWQQAPSADQKRRDLALLELTEQACEEDIRRQYRRLAMRHHPDRGGNVEHFQELLAAYQRLSL